MKSELSRVCLSAKGNDAADAFVTGDYWPYGVGRSWWLAVTGIDVSSTDSRSLNADQNLAGSGLPDRVVGFE